jgi:hypothetical protein
MRIRPDLTESSPSIERYDGLFVKLVRKYVREKFLDVRDILILSPTLGLVQGLGHLGNIAAPGEDWHNPHIDALRLRELNQKAMRLLEEVAKSAKFSEAYVNVGRNLLPIVEGIDKVLPCKIVYAEGRGIGSKAAHMKRWILQVN